MPADMNDYFKKKKPSSSSNNTNNTNRGGGSNFESPFNNMPKSIPVWLIFIAALAFAFFIFKPFTIINSGEVGIKVTTGKFEEKPLGAGLHFYIPLFQKIIPVNTRIRLITYSNDVSTELGDRYKKFEGGLRRNRAIPVLDKRGLTVNIDLAVQYSLKPESAPATIEKWGASWEEKIINSKVREVVRDVVGQYTAEQLPEMRNEIASAIQTKVRQRVEALPNQPVILSSVELRNIVLPPKIKEKIEQVQAAKQDVTIAEQEKEKAKQQAQKAAEVARGVAEKNRIEAQGEADKIRIEAEEQAKANKLISNSLTPSLIQLEQIKTQAKFNEALKVNKDAQIFLTPGGAVPNIWVDAKGKEQKAISAEQ
ncbi:prohibitin family protein [Sulfurovum sp.]|uniref:prohibitin family protein n=1 Tax=Sulfurovum sp. TaxID=1969726 RepID=UPI0025F628DA|nr:prohibitin family protein [Sulfurovum sp.]